jgi:hypothetical protein
LHGGELVVCDKGYAGRDFEQAAHERFGGLERHRARTLHGLRARIATSFAALAAYLTGEESII